jgi:hypothetical protein
MAGHGQFQKHDGAESTENADEVWIFSSIIKSPMGCGTVD